MPARRSIRVPTLASPGVPLAFRTSTVPRGLHGRRRAPWRRRSVSDERVPEVHRLPEEWPAAVDHPRDAASGDLFQDRVAFFGHTCRERAPELLVERSPRLEIVRQIEHLADVIPLRKPE